jgi:hypothetical protein
MGISAGIAAGVSDSDFFDFADIDSILAPVVWPGGLELAVYLERLRLADEPRGTAALCSRVRIQPPRYKHKTIELALAGKFNSPLLRISRLYRSFILDNCPQAAKSGLMFGMGTGPRERGIESVSLVPQFLVQSDFGRVIAEDSQLLHKRKSFHARLVFRFGICGVSQGLKQRLLLRFAELDERLVME